MEKKLSYITMAVALLFSQSLLALTDAEVEARLNEYAAKIKTLEAELANAKKSPVYEQDLGTSSSTQKLEKQIARIQNKMDSESQRFKINGFLTAAANMADDNVNGTYEIENQPSFGGDSKMGLQISAQISDKTDATVQLLARGRGTGLGSAGEPWSIAAEWAYLGYQVTDELKVRAGRLRIPFYMVSETLDVGYSYPWVRPPMEMYTTAITSYNGADALYKFSTGSVNSTLQFFLGSSPNTNNSYGEVDQELVVRLQDIYGVNLTSSVGNWTFRAMASTLSIDGESAIRTDTIVDAGTLAGANAVTILGALAGAGLNYTSCDLSATNPANCAPGGYLHASADDRFDYYALGANYDDGSLFVMSEVAKLKTKNAKLFSDNVAMYVTSGYRFGDWTPYVTYAHSYDTENAAYLAANNLNPAAVPDANKSRSIGLRKELGSGMSAKLQWDNQYDFEVDSATYGDDLNIYTLAIDAVF